jgi:hypothetical protein
VTVEALVRERLLATSAVTALVGTRIYMLVLPQRVTYPAIRVQLVDEPVRYHLRGEDGSRRARVQIDAYDQPVGSTDPYAGASAVADAVRTALSGQRFTEASSPVTLEVTGVLFVGRRPLYEPDELRIVRVSQDAIVWSKAA